MKSIVFVALAASGLIFLSYSKIQEVKRQNSLLHERVDMVQRRQAVFESDLISRIEDAEKFIGALELTPLATGKEISAPLAKAPLPNFPFDPSAPTWDELIQRQNLNAEELSRRDAADAAEKLTQLEGRLIDIEMKNEAEADEQRQKEFERRIRR